MDVVRLLILVVAVGLFAAYLALGQSSGEKLDAEEGQVAGAHFGSDAVSITDDPPTFRPNDSWPDDLYSDAIDNGGVLLASTNSPGAVSDVPTLSAANYGYVPVPPVTQYVSHGQTWLDSVQGGVSGVYDAVNGAITNSIACYSSLGQCIPAAGQQMLEVISDPPGVAAALIDDFADTVESCTVGDLYGCSYGVAPAVVGAFSGRPLLPRPRPGPSAPADDIPSVNSANTDSPNSGPVAQKPSTQKPVTIETGIQMSDGGTYVLHVHTPDGDFSLDVALVEVSDGTVSMSYVGLYSNNLAHVDAKGRLGTSAIRQIIDRLVQDTRATFPDATHLEVDWFRDPAGTTANANKPPPRIAVDLATGRRLRSERPPGWTWGSATD